MQEACDADAGGWLRWRLIRAVPGARMRWRLLHAMLDVFANLRRATGTTWELHLASALGGRCMARGHMREAPSPHPPPGGLLLR